MPNEMGLASAQDQKSQQEANCKAHHLSPSIFRRKRHHGTLDHPCGYKWKATLNCIAFQHQRHQTQGYS